MIRQATAFLDQTLPLNGVSHADVNAYGIDRGDDGDAFVASLSNGDTAGLVAPSQYAGRSSDGTRSVFLFRNNGLHIELVVDAEHPIGRDATASSTARGSTGSTFSLASPKSMRVFSL